MPERRELDALAAKFDHAGMARVIERLPTQIEIALEQKLPSIKGPFENVVVIGMGGSALPVDVVIDAFGDRLTVPLTAWRNYDLPPSAVDKSLVIASSFSGSTEEVVSTIARSSRTAANTVVLCGGGPLATLAGERGYPVIRVPIEKEPKGFQPRSAIGYTVTYLTRVLSDAGLLSDAPSDLAAALPFLRQIEVRTQAEDAATWLRDRIPVVYTDESHRMSIARIAKIKFNENSKRTALYNALPEANHNEMIGFTKALGNFGLLYLHDPASHTRIRQRFLVMKDIFQKKELSHVGFREWEIPGTAKVEKIFAALAFADWCSYTLALLDGVDPTPVPLVERFKQELETQAGDCRSV